MLRSALAILGAALTATVIPVGCGTLGAPPGGSTGLPSADVGPFRELTASEEPSTPYVFSSPASQFREPSALAMNPGEPASMGVYLYAVATVAEGSTLRDVIVRTHADDARSFYGTLLDPGTSPPTVLTASLPWEGSDLSGPSALRVGSRIFLYYAAEGGVGLAISTDGLAFEKMSDPVLGPPPEGAGWETTGPAAPSVAVLPDGTFDMMYAAGASIGEATSEDGVHFTRVDGDPQTPALDPVLSPLGAPTPSKPDAEPDATGIPFDNGQVSDPCVLPYVDAAGRLVVRVLYTGYDQGASVTARSSAIGFAARFGDAGHLTRQALPVFSVGLHEAAPAYFSWAGGEMLYAEGVQTMLGSSGYASIIAGLAPPTLTLAAPGAFPSAP